MKSVDSSELTIPQSDILSCGSFIGGVPDLLILAARLRRNVGKEVFAILFL